MWLSLLFWHQQIDLLNSIRLRCFDFGFDERVRISRIMCHNDAEQGTRVSYLRGEVFLATVQHVTKHDLESLVATTVHPPRGCRRELGCILSILQMLHSRCHVKKTGIFGQRRREKAEHPLNALRGCNSASEHQTLHVICPSMSIIMQVLQISGKCFTAVSPLAIKLSPF